TSILEALSETDERIVFPTHPRTRAFMKTHGLSERIERANNVQLIDPVGYLDMVALEKQAKKILTDSGGVQKEAYFYRVPCITLRNETEWIETTEDGWNLVVGTDPRRILHAIRTFSPNTEPTRWFGDGNASERIAELIVKKF
ncbi:MAG TPA: UDP-N-acetylglucosamine 2-epimerase, partial [bacterium]